MTNTILPRQSTRSPLLEMMCKLPDAREQRYTRGEVIVHSFAKQNDLYIVKNGFVKVYTIESNGDSKTQLLHSAGEIFPVSGFTGEVSGNDEGDHEFEAMTDCTVVRLPKRTMLNLMSEQHDLSQVMLQQIARQFTVCVAWVRNISFKHARERVAYRLLYMAHRFGRSRADGTILLPDFNQMQIAETVNMTRECVNRELHYLERRGLISTCANRIAIIDSDALRREADMDDKIFS